MTDYANYWVVIPARLNQSAIGRINLRAFLGKSLLERSIETAKSALATLGAGHQLLVIADHPEVAEVASVLGVQSISVANSKVSDIELVSSISAELKNLGATDDSKILILNPALALVPTARLLEASRAFERNSDSVHLVHENQTVEGFFAAKLHLIERPHLAGTNAVFDLAVSEAESVFIKTLSDWAVAEFFATRYRILIRTDVSEVLDQSHALRAVALADALATHRVSIVVSQVQTLNSKFFDGLGIDLITIADDLDLLALVRREEADLVVLDHHLNHAELVALLSGFCKVVTVEDFGEGAAQATMAINAMFEANSLDEAQQQSGVEVELLPTDFEFTKVAPRFSQTVKEIVVCFSGQDMNNLSSLTLRALESIEFDGRVTVIRGLGSELIDASNYQLRLKVLSNVKQYAAIFRNADLAVASSDYMISMLSAMGVPTLALSQNLPEILNHQAKIDRGVFSLGFGSLISVDSLAAHLDRLIEDTELRMALHEKAIEAQGSRTNAKVGNRILRTLGF